MGQRKKLEGVQFGKLTVVECLGVRKPDRRAVWLCVCECGKTIQTTTDMLVRGAVTSCGCKRQEGHHKTHGGRHTRLYTIWKGMKNRCYNPKQVHYDAYGGRGITICDEWLGNFAAFQKWATENGYRDDLSIDRIDNDKGYSPDNCRWATAVEQNRNRRNCTASLQRKEGGK